MEYFHSVRLEESKCKGCTNCIKHCPTEAIRVREGKAHIIQERCIDCGECIRICPNHAKIAIGHDLGDLTDYRYRVALLPPALISQFARLAPLEKILGSFLKLGFDDVYEVAVAADVVALAIRQHLDGYRGKRPVISSACPAITGLIQVRFPSLIDQLAPIATPVDLGARLAAEEAMANSGLTRDEIGIFFISPCPAKITAARQSTDEKHLRPDGVIPLVSIYGDLLKNLPGAPEVPSRAGSYGYGWGQSGGENANINRSDMLSVDGIRHVTEVLTRIEQGDFKEVEYFEAQACPEGCVGGSLMVCSPFLARLDLMKMVRSMPGDVYMPRVGNLATRPVTPRQVMSLDPDLNTALMKMQQLEATLEMLPGLDCGACGSPNCRALAEDIVRGDAQDTDCVFLLRDRVRVLAEEVVELAQKLPPSMAKPERKEK